MFSRSRRLRPLGLLLLAAVAASACTSNADAPSTCTASSDCPSGVCNLSKATCEAASCTDGARNGNETGLDCGGPDCAKCGEGTTCKDGADCATGVCRESGSGLACQPASASDGVKNGTETDVDCGGAGNPACVDAMACVDRSDCRSGRCADGVCAPVTPADGVQNGKETDVDCGGGEAQRCADTLRCLVDDDCQSDVCKDQGDGKGLRCQVPTSTDGKKNGGETDADCGGPAAPKCTIGKRCVVGSDCESLGCNYQGRCAAGRSCTAHYGGDTCGLGGAGGLGPAQWEDCCAALPVTPAGGKSVKLGKFQVTAGRMRAFLTSIGYDVRGFVKQARAAGKIPAIPGDPSGKTVLDPAWDMFLPTSFDGSTAPGEISDCAQGGTTDATGTTCKPGTNQPGIYTAVKRHLGGFIFKGNNQTSTGCFVGAPGTHAFRFPDGQQDGEAPQLDQNEYDTKSMQCIDYLVAQSFCVWDGGRLETIEEWKAAFGPGALPWSAETTRQPVAPGTSTYWGCRFPWATDADQSACGKPWNATTSTIEYADYKYSYEYPKLQGADYIVFISAPGRTRGRGPMGHADVIGNNFELTSTVTWKASPHDALHRWSGNGSWEVHDFRKDGGGSTGLLNKYGKLGLRCAYP